jgi:hypothetical protein
VYFTASAPPSPKVDTYQSDGACTHEGDNKVKEIFTTLIPTNAVVANLRNGSWVLGDLFEKDYGHSGSITKLWDQRCKVPCTKSVYPFHDGEFADFEPIFTHLIENNINDSYSDAYTNAFMPTARCLVAEAEDESEDLELRKRLYLNANTVFRLARFLYIGTSLKRAILEEQKAVHLRGPKLWDIPITKTITPHIHASNGDTSYIALYIRKPSGLGLLPTILLITGLNSHRPDNNERITEFLSRNWATVICDILGTHDCLANKRDPLYPDRLFNSILAFVASTPDLDDKKAIAWGLSAEG